MSNGDSKMLDTAKSLLPLIILAVGIVVTFTRGEAKIDQLQNDFGKLLAVDTKQSNDIDINENKLIGVEKDIAQILSTQKTMIDTEQENTTAIINAIGRIKANNGN